MTQKLRRRDLLILGAAATAAPLRALRAQGPSEPIPLNIGCLPISSSGPVFLGLAKGWFREGGIDLKVTKFNTSGQVGVAVVSGDLDVGITGLTASFYNMGGKGALKIIAGQSREQPGFESICYIASNKAWDEGVRSFPDFVGKRLGNTTIGSTIHYSVILAAKKYKIDVNAIKLVQLQTLPNMAAAFRGGTLDGAVPTQQIWRDLEAEGIGRFIAWVGDLTPWQLGAVFTSPKAIEGKREGLKRFVTVWKRACAEYNAAFNQLGPDRKKIEGPNYAEDLKILAEVIGQTPEQVAKGLAYIPSDASLEIDDVRRQVSVWQEFSLIDKSITADEVIDTSFL